MVENIDKTVRFGWFDDEQTDTHENQKLGWECYTQ